jgi:hypothetical protein
MPASIPTLDDCLFYHTMELPGVGLVAGSWDLRGRFDEYVGGVGLAGRSVLDVGTASGFLSFEAERRGARAVTSFEAGSVDLLQRNPGFVEPDRRLEMQINSYRLAHHLLGSRAVPVYGDVYRLRDVVPAHEVVLVGQILVHLRDPFGALQEIAGRCERTLVIAEGMFEHPDPIAVYLGESTPNAWLHWSTTLYRQFLDKLGFEVVSIRSGSYRCNSRDKNEQVWTLVAQRR